MKKKVLFSIVAVALFGVVIGFGINEKQEENIKVKNIEALAGFSYNEGLGMYVPDACSGDACCVQPADNDEGYTLYHEKGF